MIPPDNSQLGGASPDEAVLRALVPGARTKLYRRTWIVGQVVRERNILRGRLGFRAAGSSAELWDDQAQKFVEVELPAGHATPFAVDLSTLRLALQPRPPEINISPATRALRAILDQSNSGWVIRGRGRRPVDLRTWLGEVTTVTSFRATVRRPNPNYEDADELESILEGSEAEVLRWEAQSDQGLDTDSSFIAQTIRHVERGYGDARVTGTRNGQETVYSTDLGREEQATEVPADPETGEVSQASLDEVLAAPDSEDDTG